MDSIAPPSSALDRNHQSFFTTGMAVIWFIALANLLFHIYFNNRYGYFRDEFDYMSCGDHLAWGYVDQPPLIPLLIHICLAVLGDSLRSIRFIPALASSLLIVQTAAIARELGGRRYALLLSALCALIAPQYLSNGSLLGTNCLEPNLWMGCAYFAILAIKRNDPRYWLWFGVVAGLGLEEKYSIAVFGLGIVVGLLLTEQRRVFLNKWIWLGGLAAFLIFFPNALWNIKYDWPFVQLMRAIRAEGRDVVLGPFPYFPPRVVPRQRAQEPERRFMTQRRMLANASFRLSGSDVTHDVSGRSPSDVPVCQECGERFRPKRHWQKQCSPRCRQRAYVLRHPMMTSFYYGA